MAMHAMRNAYFFMSTAPRFAPLFPEAPAQDQLIRGLDLPSLPSRRRVLVLYTYANARDCQSLLCMLVSEFWPCGMVLGRQSRDLSGVGGCETNGPSESC
jgi:hypothetical protein